MEHEGFEPNDAGLIAGSMRLAALKSLRKKDRCYYDSDFKYKKGDNFYLRKMWNAKHGGSAKRGLNHSLSDEESPVNRRPIGRLSFADHSTSTPHDRFTLGQKARSRTYNTYNQNHWSIKARPYGDKLEKPTGWKRIKTKIF